MALWFRWLIGLLAASLTLLTTELALAQRVVLLEQDGASPLLREALHRLDAELRIHDFHVIVVRVNEPMPPSPARLAEIAEAHDAVASVAFVALPGRTTADVWLSDRVTGKTSIRTLNADPSSEAPTVLAIRAVDLLRLSLRELSPTAPIADDVVGAHPERAPEHVRDWARTPPTETTRFELRTEGAAFAFGSQSTVGFGIAASLGYQLSKSLVARFVFAGPSQGSRVTAAQASADLQQMVGLAELGWGTAAGDLLQLEATASIGLHDVGVFGDAEDPLVADSGHSQSIALGGGLGAAVALTESVELGLSIRALATPSRTVVALADESRDLGPLVLLGTAGIHVGF